MILRLFKGAKPAHFIFVPFFAVLLWLKYLLIPQNAGLSFETNPMPLYDLISDWLGEYAIISKLTALILLIIIALWLSRLNKKFIIVSSRTYLPTFLFLIIVSGYLPLQQLNPAIFACFFLVYCLEIMFETFKKEGLALNFFQAAFLVSLASLFYARSVYLMLVIWVGLSILRAFNWREWVLTLLGFITPYILLFSFYYLSDQNLREEWELITGNLLPDRHMVVFNNYYMIFFGFLLLLLLAASFRMLQIYRGLKIYIRKFYKLSFWVFVICLLVYYLLYSRSVEFIYFMAVPVSYILTNYLFNMRLKLIGDIMMGILLCLYGMILFYN